MICLTGEFSTDCVGAGKCFGGVASVFNSVVLAAPELVSLKRMPSGLAELKANPNTTLAPSRPTSCQAICRAREPRRVGAGEGDEVSATWDAATGLLRCLLMVTEPSMANLNRNQTHVLTAR